MGALLKCGHGNCMLRPRHSSQSRASTPASVGPCRDTLHEQVQSKAKEASWMVMVTVFHKGGHGNCINIGSGALDQAFVLA